MSYKLIKYAGNYVAGCNEYVCDSRDDIDSLPTIPEASFGSVATALEDGSKWIMNSSGEWVELQNV